MPATRAWPQFGLGLGGGAVVRTAVGAVEVGPGLRPPGAAAGGDPAQPATASSSTIVAPSGGKCTAPASLPCAGMSAVRIPDRPADTEAWLRCVRSSFGLTGRRRSCPAARAQRLRARSHSLSRKWTVHRTRPHIAAERKIAEHADFNSDSSRQPRRRTPARACDDGDVRSGRPPWSRRRAHLVGHRSPTRRLTSRLTATTAGRPGKNPVDPARQHRPCEGFTETLTHFRRSGTPGEAISRAADLRGSAQPRGPVS